MDSFVKTLGEIMDSPGEFELDHDPGTRRITLTLENGTRLTAYVSAIMPGVSDVDSVVEDDEDSDEDVLWV